MSKPTFTTIGISATAGERQALLRAAKNYKGGMSLSRFILTHALKAAKASMAPRRTWANGK